MAEDIIEAALLHDVGKLFVPENILFKPEKLTDWEYLVMKQHSGLGYKFLKDNNLLSRYALSGVYSHHERYDGGGYPAHLQSKEIPFEGRVLAVADVYDAITCSRPYRDPLTPLEALEAIVSLSGKSFEPELVSTLSSIVTPYKINDSVILSNGYVAKVKSYSRDILKPCIYLYLSLDRAEYVNLEDMPVLNENIFVKKIITEMDAKYLLSTRKELSKSEVQDGTKDKTS